MANDREWKPLVHGAIHVTGEHDVGKTTFCLEYGADPKRMLMFDDDVKGRGAVEQIRAMGLEFGRYVDLVKVGEKKTELAFHDAVLQIIKEVKPGDFDVIVWDTWTNFAATCHPYVLRHATEFRAQWSSMGQIKGAQQWQEARRYETILIEHLLSLAPTVFLVTHLKDVYINNAKVPGKQTPAASRTLDRVPAFRIWLRQNPDGRAVPIGLVLKRLDKKIFVPGKGIRTVNVLPRKIVPAENEYSLWDTIRRYWDEPFGDVEMGPNEMPDEFEMSILDGTLTKEQTHTFQLMMQAAGVLERDEPDSIAVRAMDEDTEAAVLEMSESGKKPPEIAAALGLTMPEVLRTIKNSERAEEEEVDFE